MKKISLIFLFIVTFSFAQDKVKVDLSNPNATIYTHLYFLQPNSYNETNAAQTIYGYQGEEAAEIAVKLKKILDGKGLKVDFTKVPFDPNYADTLGLSRTYRYVLFPNNYPKIYVEKIDGKWYYSRETANLVPALYNDIYPWYADKLQEFIPDVGHKKILGMQVWQYILLLMLLAITVGLFFILHKVFYFILRRIQYILVHKSNLKINTGLKKLSRPLVLLVLTHFVKTLLPLLLLPLDLNTFLFLSINIMVTVFWIFVFLKLVHAVMDVYADYAESTHQKLDDQLVPILRNFLTGIVLFLGLLKMLTLFGVQPVTVIAGASIGGLALALASQDTVKNLIGTLMIFVDKPFHIGDWIEAGDVIGTVETVGFRSTTVRAADTSVYQIPNSTLSEMVVNNKGLRSFRRYQTKLGIRYDTPPQLIEAFVTGIRKIIDIHPGTRNGAYNVEFISFGDSALEVLLNVYFVELDWNLEQSSKHALHMAILNLASELGIEFAFPSSTVIIEQFPEKTSLATKYDLNKNRIQKILDNIK